MRRCNLWGEGGYFERAESKRASQGQPAPLLLFNCQAAERIACKCDVLIALLV